METISNAIQIRQRGDSLLFRHIQLFYSVGFCCVEKIIMCEMQSGGFVVAVRTKERIVLSICILAFH